MNSTIGFRELREKMYSRGIRGFSAPVLRLAGDNYFLMAVDTSGRHLEATVTQKQYEELRGIKLRGSSP